MAFGLQPTWPLHLQRLSGYTEIQLARLATILLAHHGGAQVLFNFFSSILFQVVMLIFHRPRVLLTGTFYTKTRCSIRIYVSLLETNRISRKDKGISSTIQHLNSDIAVYIHPS